jgi:hypothetical protein
MSNQNVSSFTTSQVETLQHHIRLFKALSQRYIESSIPKSLPEGYTPPIQVFQRHSTQNNAVSQGHQGYSNPARPTAPQQAPHTQQSQIQQLYANPLKYSNTSNSSSNASNMHPKPSQQPPRGPSPGMPYHQPPSQPTSIAQYNEQVMHHSSNQQLFQQQQHQSYQQQIQQPPAQPQGPTLSWQCFNSLLAIGPPKPPDGMIAIAASVSLLHS